MPESYRAEYALPIVDLEGSPRERGRAHGEAVRERIAYGLDRWSEEVAGQFDRPLAQVVQEFYSETSFTRAIQRWTPDLLEEVRGIAEGAGHSYETMLTYSLLDEWGWFAVKRYRTRVGQLGCSAIGLRRGAGGYPIASQTHDLGANWNDALAIQRIHGANGIRVLSLTAAGAVALSGCNDRGVSINCNALAEELPHSAAGLPVAFVIRGVLERTSLADARQFVESVLHASGQNYILGGPEGVCDLECSAERVIESQAGLPVVLHTNHPIAQPDFSAATRTDHSYSRQTILESRRSSLRSLQDVWETLEHPGICQYYLGGSQAGIVNELSVPPRVFMTFGAPDRNPWRQIPFEKGVAPRVARMDGAASQGEASAC